MKILYTLLLLSIALPTMAQTDADREVHSLFGALAERSVGGYIAVGGKTFQALGADGFLLGGRAGVVFDHRLTLGLAGYGLCTPLANRAYNDRRADNGLSVPDGLALRMGYGGLFIEPVFFDASVVHFSLPITFGVGGVSYGYPPGDGGMYPRVIRTDAQAFFFVEPGVEMEVNILTHVRLGLGAAYFHTTDIDLPATDSDVLRRAMLQFTVKVGEF